MILKVNCYSLFLPAKLKKKVKGFIFLSDKESINKNCGVFDISSFLDMESDDVMGSILSYFDKGDGMVGVQTLDGLFVEPERLGKWLLNLKKQES